MAPSHAAALVNIAGFIAGTVLYAMLFAMVLRPRSSLEPRRGVDGLLLLTALLGLAWNIEAFVTSGLRDFGVPPLPALVQSVALGALGLLPAVVVHSVLRAGVSRLTSPAALVLTLIAYALSGCAAFIQVGSALQGSPVPAAAGLRLLTFGFSALILPLALVTRRQPGARRALWMSALAVFAVSALHLSQHERLQATWTGELIGHHASLPIALSILYQEYPFALADVFLKRALALLALMGAALLTYVGIESGGILPATTGGTVQALLFLSVAIAGALVYPSLMRLSAWFVDTLVLRRVDYDLLRAALARRLSEAVTPAAALDTACDALGPALNAADVRWIEISRSVGIEGLPVVDVSSSGTSGDVLVPSTEPPRYSVQVRSLQGGRRLLSDDVAMLESVAQVIARRVDALRVERERYDRQLREQDIRRLASEAELRALRAQMNPHFLFNALTTIGHLINTSPERALTTLLQLTELLRRVLRSENGPSTLGEELGVLRAYLEIEQARFEDRLSVEIDVPAALQGAQLPPLLVQPLVENAIKHGIAPFRRHGRLTLRARLDGKPDVLVITVEDSGPGLGGVDEPVGRRSAGVGLRNVEERLARAYGDNASLRLTSSPGRGTIAELRLPYMAASRRGRKSLAQYIH
jgi:two-component system LytT family sensor kinase